MPKKDCFKTINRANLLFNINFLRKKLHKSKLCAVVKSDAYGHNANKISDLISEKIDCFAVANNIEAIALKTRHPSKPCLILSPVSKHELADAIRLNATFSVQSLDELLTLNSTARKLNKIAYFHLQINSGMNRFGVSQKDEILAITQRKLPHARLTGIYSHFGSGDGFMDLRAENQIAVFHNLSDHLPSVITRHFCNTQNTLTHPAEHMNMVRCGLALYGYGNEYLKPVMQVYAKIIAIQEVQKGDYIGYGLEHIATEKTHIATLAIGYAKGLPRLWGKDGFVLINNRPAKIVGNICMEATFAEIGGIPAKIGDYATILSDLPTLNANILASGCHTIPYEILTNFRNIPLK